MTQKRLMRLVHGEADAGEARALERRMADDAGLAAEHRRLQAAWDALEPPPEPSREELLRDDFLRTVMAAARRSQRQELSWSRAPAWARAGAAVSLAVGLVIGLLVGLDAGRGAGRGAGRAPVPGGEVAGAVKTPGTDTSQTGTSQTAEIGTAGTGSDTGAGEWEDDWSETWTAGEPLSLAESYWLTLEGGRDGGGSES